jgi:type VI secretion system ImpC/EvpB family protein
MSTQSATPHGASEGPSPIGSLDAAIDESIRRGREGRGSFLAGFLAESDPCRAAARWVEASAGGGARLTLDRLRNLLSADIARLDEVMGRQVNAILHHPQFQALEAAWRGVAYLVNQVESDSQRIKIKLLSVSWKEVSRDQERAIEFDQSQLFRKVYSAEFDMPGGEPFGVLVGNYEVRHRVTPDHPMDDVAVLSGLAQVAAAAFAPFIAGVHPALFGLDTFQRLELPHNVGRAFDQIEYLKWRNLRDAADSRFVGLTMPRVLMRLPYEDDPGRVDNFRFREDVEGPDRSKYLWGSAAFAFAGVLIRSFRESSWFTDIRGVQRGTESGGLVTGLPVHSFCTDSRGVAQKSCTDLMVTDLQERQFSSLGFIPLCWCQDSEYAAFYGNPSVQRPKAYAQLEATMNARLSAMLQYMFCVSRFAHYLKVLARDKMGSFAGARELEDMLKAWVAGYVTNDPAASPAAKARYPLMDAKVEVGEIPGNPGAYHCAMHLLPHSQPDQLTAAIVLRTEVSNKIAP